MEPSTYDFQRYVCRELRDVLTLSSVAFDLFDADGYVSTLRYL